MGFDENYLMVEVGAEDDYLAYQIDHQLYENSWGDGTTLSEI